MKITPLLASVAPCSWSPFCECNYITRRGLLSVCLLLSEGAIQLYWQKTPSVGICCVFTRVFYHHCCTGTEVCPTDRASNLGYVPCFCEHINWVAWQLRGYSPLPLPRCAGEGLITLWGCTENGFWPPVLTDIKIKLEAGCWLHWLTEDTTGMEGDFKGKLKPAPSCWISSCALQYLSFHHFVCLNVNTSTRTRAWLDQTLLVKGPGMYRDMHGCAEYCKPMTNGTTALQQACSKWYTMQFAMHCSPVARSVQYIHSPFTSPTDVGFSCSFVSSSQTSLKPVPFCTWEAWRIQPVTYGLWVKKHKEHLVSTGSAHTCRWSIPSSPVLHMVPAFLQVHSHQGRGSAFSKYFLVLGSVELSSWLEPLCAIALSIYSPEIPVQVFVGYHTLQGSTTMHDLEEEMLVCTSITYWEDRVKLREFSNSPNDAKTKSY